uniref:PACT_coil_coil domain-containing protein n=1 Tax=Mesocestoides corti TaxID=53468 RepID=A0A5K3EK23_MESCO
MQCLQDELMSGKDECFMKVIEYFEAKNSHYYKKLLDFFGSNEYFQEFRTCYENSDSPPDDDQAQGPLYEQLCAILELRALLASEVEALQCLKQEIEDYPTDFDIQNRLTKSLKEQQQLERELESLKELNEKLQMENNAFNAILEEAKKDFNEKLIEANERAKKAEKAFVELTRRRSAFPAPESTLSRSQAIESPLPNDDSQRQSSLTVPNALASIAFPCRSSLDKVRRSSLRFKEYSTLTACEGFDSLDEDSSDEKEATEEGETKNSTSQKSASLDAQTKSPALVAPPVPMLQIPSAIVETPSPDSSPVKNLAPSHDAFIAGLVPSKSSTPRKSLPTGLPTPRQTDTSPPEPIMPIPVMPPLTTSATATPHAHGAEDTSSVVDKEAYLRLYDEVLELRSELDRVRSKPTAHTSLVQQHSTVVTQSQNLGLTTQLCDLRDQVCAPPEEASFASPAPAAVGGVTNPIPLSDNKHFTDWSISLDHTNVSSVLLESGERPNQDGEEDAARTPRASVSFGQQADLPYRCLNCSSDIPSGDPNNPVLVPSPTSTLREVNLDFSESRQASTLECTDTARSHVFGGTGIVQTIDASANEALERRVVQLSEALVGAAYVCADLQKRLSSLQSSDANSAASIDFDADALINGDVSGISPVLRKLDAEVDRIASSFTHLRVKLASQPSYEAEITKLKEKLEEAERLLVERPPIDPHTTKLRVDELLEAERAQLQRELNQRLADCGSTHATSVAELERVQADLSGRLAAAEIRGVQLESERNAVMQKLSATERFLNEQLQERELEREEFQSEVAALRNEIITLRSKVLSLERQQSSTPTPSISPRDPVAASTTRTAVPSTPSVFGFDESLEQRTDSHSDVDDSPTFELTPTPRVLGDLPNAGTLFKHNWSRPHSAGDAALRQQLAQQSQLPVRLSTACVGGSPVEHVDVSVSAQSSSLSGGCSTSTEFDGEGANLASEEEEDVETTTRTAAALGVITTTVTTTTRKKTNSHAVQKRRSGLSRHCTASPTELGNNVGLDVEMRHVAEMDKMRETLALTQSSLAEKCAELDLLRSQLSARSRSTKEGVEKPNTSDHQQQFQFPPNRPCESVLIQTVSNAPPDPGACWSCNALPVTYASVCVQTQEASSRGSPASRESTMSPPPPSAGHSISSGSSNAEISVSTPSTGSGVSSAAGEADDKVDEQIVEEEDLCQPLEQVHSFSSESDHLVADLEEAQSEIQALRSEIDGLINYQDDLHRDFELVQTMLEERQSEVERLQQELLVVPVRLQADFDASIRKLQKKMNDKCEVVEERDEDLYVLNEEKEALANRVAELEKELDALRISATPSTQTDANREEAASQTDPPLSTVDSAIQVDFTRPPHTAKTDSCGDTDCASEDDLPFDGDVISPPQNAAVESAAPRTTEEVKAAVDHLQVESCRLLSLSLKAVDHPDAAVQPDDPTDYKSQVITRLIEANRMLKSALEEVTKQSEQTCHSLSQAGTPTRDETTPMSGANFLSNRLYSGLLSALLADRKATLSLVTSSTIDQMSNAALGGFVPQSSSGRLKGTPSLGIGDVMQALADYANTEEERWNVLSSALSSDRTTLLADVDALNKREEFLLDEVAHLTEELAARDGVLAEKASAMTALSAQVETLEAAVSSLRKQLDEARAVSENQLNLSRRQIDEERERIADLEAKLASSQDAVSRASEQVRSLERDLQKSSSDVRLERNRSELAETRIAQLEQEIKALKLSHVRNGPKVSINGGVPLTTSVVKKDDYSAISRVSNQLASLRRQAIQAEKLSRDLHACNQGLRVSMAEAELALLPACLDKENGHLCLVNGSNSGGEDESPSGEFGQPLPKQLTDSGFADAPVEIRRLYLTCMRLVRLVSSTAGPLSSSSSSSDSLNNPAELLRHAMLRGKQTPSGRLDYMEHTSPIDVYACVSEIEAQVRTMVPVGGAGSGGDAFSGSPAANTALSQAKQMILSGVARLDLELAKVGATGDDVLGFRPPTDSKSVQCSIVTDHQSSGDSRAVPLEKFRHMSARYLRMESYRRALVYQKQYLLLLLGDFQHSVQRVTASLGQGLLMGTSSRQDVEGNDVDAQEWPLESRPALVRFRAAARCVMVIHRVKQLRLKWQRTGIRNHATPLFPNSSGSRTQVANPTGIGNSTPTTLVSASPTQVDLFNQPVDSRLSKTTYSPRTGFSNSELELSRRNHSTPLVLPSSSSNHHRHPYPRSAQVEASSSFQQHHRVSTSTSSSVRRP